MQSPRDCQTMTELRVQIDRIDTALVALLVERATYIDRAAEIKAEAGLPARIDDRVEQVVQNVRVLAKAQGLSEELTEGLWRQLIEWSIAREEHHLG